MHGECSKLIIRTYETIYVAYPEKPARTRDFIRLLKNCRKHNTFKRRNVKNKLEQIEKPRISFL